MVKVYITDVSGLPDPKDNPELLNGLSPKRKDKIVRYRKEKDRKQSLGAGYLLKSCLDEYGINIEDIYYGENGKPEIEGVYFNLSHSFNKVVCVISDKPIGCDIEKIGELKEKIAERFFTNSENEHLNRFSGDEKTDEFYRLWTMKESYMKMTGEGMSLPLDRVEFVFDSNIKVYRDKQLCDCIITEYEVPGYKLTICAEDKEIGTEIIQVKMDLSCTEHVI